MNRPNILWVSVEDTSPRFGCYGDPVARTPNIDRLAGGGCVYRNAFATAPACAPSRAAVITGMYQTAIGAHHMRTGDTYPDHLGIPTPYEAVPPPYVKAFPEYLRASGYYSTNNDKTDYQFAAPISAWDECGPAAHWRHRDAGQPFFAVFNPMVTHESGMWADRPVQTDPAAVTVPPWLADTPATRESLARHYDNIASADTRVGELLDQLAEDGLADNTVVMLWSDHGEGLPRAKHAAYDAGLRVPMIVRWPGVVAAGTHSDDVVSLVDLAPTVLSLAGVEPPPYLHGTPFVGYSARHRDYAFSATDRSGATYRMSRTVRDHRYRYVRNYLPDRPMSGWRPYSQRHPALQELWRLYLADELDDVQRCQFERQPFEELYDCAADPDQIDNLAADPWHDEILERLRTELDAWRERFDTFGEVPEVEMVERMWPGGRQPVVVAPQILVMHRDAAGPEVVSGPHTTPDGETFTGAILIVLHGATQGSSIIYRTGHDAPDRWHLYTGPIRVSAGRQLTLHAKAVRLGYRDSDEVPFTATA